MKRLHYGWVIAGLGAVIFSFYSMRFNTFGVLLVPITEQFHWDRGALSWAPSIAALFSSLLSLYIGRLADRYGPRYLVTGAAFMIGAGFLLMSRVSQLWQAVTAWGLLMGGAQAFIYIPIISSVPRWFAVKQSTAVGIAVVGFGLGATAWPPVTQLLIDNFGWQNACVILGLINLTVILTLAQFLKRDPAEMGILPYGAATGGGTTTAGATTGTPGLTLLTALRSPRFWLMGGIFLGFFSGLNVMYVHVVAHARDIGINPMIAAGTVSLIGGTSIIGRLSIGPISDRIGILLALCSSLVLSVTALSLLVWSPGAWSFYVFAIVFGMAYGTFVPLETAVPSVLFGVRSLGGIMALLGLFTNIGITLAPPVAGAIFDATGKYQAAFIICLGLALMSLTLSVILWRLKDTPKSHNIN